jgi:hypothetical protein
MSIVRSQSSRPTAEFHALIRRVAAGELRPLAAAGEIGVLPARVEDWPGMASRLAESLVSDMGEGLAAVRAGALVSALGPLPPSPEILAARIDGLCAEEAGAFAELIGCFVLALAQTARLQNRGEVVFLARDAIPIHLVATIFAQRGLVLPRLRLVDLNRGMLPGFPARLAARGETARRLRAHAEGSAGAGPALLVDTGVYGTLVTALEEIGALPGLSTLFLFSKHPRRPGFLNQVADAARLGLPGARLIEVLSDTMECWPKPYRTGRLEDGPQGPFAAAAPSDAICVLASLSLYAHLARWAWEAPLDRLDAEAALGRLARRPTPFMLPEPLPAWEHAGAWLARDIETPLATG